MYFLFGKRLTPQEKLRAQKRTLDKAIRELDRERKKLQRQEKKIESELKKMASKGQRSACTIMAKDLIRTRQHIDKLYNLTHPYNLAIRLKPLYRRFLSRFKL